MDNETLKNHLINSLLAQQAYASGHPPQYHTTQQSNSAHNRNTPGGTLKSIELPDQAVLDDFKNQVRMWVEIDNNIRKLKQAARERNAIKKQLTEKILKFMAKYNIEDLNTKDGSRLRYKVSQVKEPLTAQKIKERLEQNINNIHSVDDLHEKVFTTNKVEKVTLRRLKKRTLDL